MRSARKKKKYLTVKDLVIEFFKKHPNEDLEHGPVVDWVTARYKNLYHKPPRDPWRTIRGLYEKGFLIKVRKGVYRYDPQSVRELDLEDFSEEQKKAILERDDYKCVVCGRGVKDGVELHVDHIKPKSAGGKAVIENGQTLCSEHNLMKKKLKQTEAGKKMFIRLYNLAKKENLQEIKNFCEGVLEVYEKYKINSHIKWDK